MALIDDAKRAYEALSLDEQKRFLETIPLPGGDIGLIAIWITVLIVLGAIAIALIIAGAILNFNDKDATAAWTAVGIVVGGLVGLIGGQVAGRAMARR